MNSSSSLSFDIDSIREIAALLRESELGEICLETTGDNDTPSRVRLKRAVAAPVMMAAPVTDTDTEQGAPTAPTENEVPASPASFEITSHAVGVFREARTPVEVGDEVKIRQVLGSVESLRVPNEIVAPSAGRVLTIETQEGQGVEYGQVLFVIEEI